METMFSNTMNQSNGYQTRQDTSLRLSDDAIKAGIIDLMVGISLRGWLTNYEMNFLDNLGMEKAAIFLIRDGHYLHPEEVELFPMDVIKASIRQGGDAVFSHRHAVANQRSSHVHTAMIYESSSHTDILGLIGPDELTPTQKTEDWFCHLVQLFREATVQINDILSELNDCLSKDIATIIINRSSGRVLHINELAENLLEIEAREVTGSEYGRVKHLLRRSLTTHKITIDNLDLGELFLSTVAMQPVRIKNTLRHSNTATVRDALREQIAAMQATTHQMEQLGETLNSSAVIETARSVRDEVVQLSQHLFEPKRNDRTVQIKNSSSLTHVTDRAEIS